MGVSNAFDPLALTVVPLHKQINKSMFAGRPPTTYTHIVTENDLFNHHATSFSSVIRVSEMGDNPSSVRNLVAHCRACGIDSTDRKFVGTTNEIGLLIEFVARER